MKIHFKNLENKKYLLPLHPQFGLWCNGNTAGFGPVVLGSSPSKPTKNFTIL